jgi:hypothetical protein
MKTYKTAFLTIVSGLILFSAGGTAFAGSATFDRLSNSAGNVNFDNAAPGRGTVAEPKGRKADKNDAPPAASTTTTAGSTPPAVSTGTVADTTPPKPTTLAGFMKEDLKNNKSSYLMAGVTGGLTGYFLMGSVMAGALLGFGAIVLFLLVYRNLDKVKDK